MPIRHDAVDTGHRRLRARLAGMLTFSAARGAMAYAQAEPPAPTSIIIYMPPPTAKAERPWRISPKASFSMLPSTRAAGYQQLITRQLYEPTTAAVFKRFAAA